jgi:hypothetical protein
MGSMDIGAMMYDFVIPNFNWYGKESVFFLLG